MTSLDPCTLATVGGIGAATTLLLGRFQSPFFGTSPHVQVAIGGTIAGFAIAGLLGPGGRERTLVETIDRAALTLAVGQYAVHYIMTPIAARASTPCATLADFCSLRPTHPLARDSGICLHGCVLRLLLVRRHCLSSLTMTVCCSAASPRSSSPRQPGRSRSRSSWRRSVQDTRSLAPSSARVSSVASACAQLASEWRWSCSRARPRSAASPRRLECVR